MQWTSDAPTEAGWWWMRSCKGNAEMVLLEGIRGRLYVHIAGSEDDERLQEYVPHCQWCGPILPPE